MVGTGWRDQQGQSNNGCSLFCKPAFLEVSSTEHQVYKDDLKEIVPKVWETLYICAYLGVLQLK